MKSERSLLWVLLIALGLNGDPVQGKAVDHWAPFTQPDGTTFGGHMFGDVIEINWVTADGYEFVYNHEDGYFYYAELGNKGEYRASIAKVGIEVMLRIYFMQQCYGLSDPAMEDSLYDVESMRRFAGVDLDHIPDETTIYKFRHFLERHRLTAILFRRTEQYLSDRGLLLSEGTIVDATIVQAPLFDQEPGPATGPGDGLYEERDHLALRSESACGERSPGASAPRDGDLGVGT